MTAGKMEAGRQAAYLGEAEGDGDVSGSGLHPRPAAELLPGHPSPPPAWSRAEGLLAQQPKKQQVSLSPLRLTKNGAGGRSGTARPAERGRKRRR